MVINPLIIMKGVTILKKWFSQTNMLNGYLLRTSNSGYTNDMLSIDWIKYFNYCTRGRTLGVWRLLIFDGFDSHMTKNFLDYYIEAKIILFSLPPYLSQNLQPLNVVIFQPFKHYYFWSVEEVIRKDYINFNKVEFLQAIYSIRLFIFKYLIIMLSWC